MVRNASRPVVQPRLEALEERNAPSAVGITIQDGSIRDGKAIEVGHVLFVEAFQPGHDTVQITDNGQGDVQVSWNGGAVHDFTGVSDIIVAANGKTNDVTFTLAGKLDSHLQVDVFLRGEGTFTEHLNAPTQGNLTVDLITE